MMEEKREKMGIFDFSKSDRETLLLKMQEEAHTNPPKIVVIGASGVGKSSTINAMFNTQLPISHTVACTKQFTRSEFNIEAQQSKGFQFSGIIKLQVFDAPGLGENVEKDPEYLQKYKRYLPMCDVALWVVTARNRAIALDQMYLHELREFQDKFVFGLNQVELVEPLNWVEQYNIPSREQEDVLNAIVADRKAHLETTLRRKIAICSYSAKKRFNLQPLFTSVIENLPPKRRWMFSVLKNFDPNRGFGELDKTLI